MDKENLELKISNLHIRLMIMIAAMLASIVISVMALSHC
jgi:hypothetical protein